METRVRIVLADDIGRHVLRTRGFSSCWYLVPKDVKLVGDLAHSLLKEFGLRKRCPLGLELRLEELPVLATQSIRIVRDNDTIVVHCPPLESQEVGGSSETSSSESEVETLKKRKQRETRQKEKERPQKKIKKVKDRVKEIKHQQNEKEKNRTKSAVEVLKKNSKEESSSSSSSSSESSSSSSSSSSESEDEAVAQRNVKQKVTSNKQQTEGVASAKTSNGVASKANVSEQTGKEPRRRRRRLRQRNGGRQRNGNQTNTEDKSGSQAQSSGYDTAPQGQGRTTTAPGQTRQPSNAGERNGVSVAGPRNFPRAKAHILFDEETGDQVAVQHDESLPDSVSTQRAREPELAKYGPSCSGSQRTRASRDNSNGDNGDERHNGAPKRKGKGKYEDKWKRPYEIVASVHDKKLEMSGTTAPDLTELLTSYPSAPIAPSSFQPRDIIAFKTLTLCLETFQPVMSDWQCGQVQMVDTDSAVIELSNWTLAANGESVEFREAPNTEQVCVQTSEICELRYLSKSSYSAVQQTLTEGVGNGSVDGKQVAR